MHLGHGVVVALEFLHRQVGIGERRHLREVGDDENLMTIAERRQRPADGKARLATDAGIDLVEDEDRRGFRQHAAQRQHRSGQFATRGDLRQ